MSPASSSIDATSKRWLAALALAVVISVVLLTRSFISAFSPPVEVVPETQQAAPVPSVKVSTTVSTTAQPEWNVPPQSSSPAVQHIHPNSSSETTDFGKPKSNAEIRKQMVHNQAEDLRAMAKQNRLPKSFGHLTTEQIDEMEKNGIIIE